MARQSLSSLLRRQRQFEAVSGRTLTPQERRGIIEPELEQRRIENIQRERIGTERALRERQLGLQERGLAETERAQREAEQLAQEQLEAQELAGTLTAVGTVGGTLATQTKAGQAFLERTGERVFGAGAAPSVTAPAAPTIAPTVPAGITTGAGEAAVIGAEAPTAVAGAEVAPAAGAFAAPSLAVGVPTAIAGQVIGKQIGGTAGAAVQGAGLGFAVGGPVGALAGFALGGVSETTMICTELNKQGYLSDDIYRLDDKFRKTIDDKTYKGYVKFATPIVDLMRKSPFFTWIVSLIALPWSYEMAHKMNPVYKSNKFGKIIMKFGIPFCRMVGGLNGKVRFSIKRSCTADTQ